MQIPGAPRVAHRVGRFVASADRRRGQRCTFGNPPAVHLKVGECCSNKRSHFCRCAANCSRTLPVRQATMQRPARVPELSCYLHSVLVCMRRLAVESHGMPLALPHRGVGGLACRGAHRIGQRATRTRYRSGVTASSDALARGSRPPTGTSAIRAHDLHWHIRGVHVSSHAGPPFVRCILCTRVPASWIGSHCSWAKILRACVAGHPPFLRGVPAALAL
jgi:hypothetical protein